MRHQNAYLSGIDRWTVLIYALLVIMGWLNVYAAVYNDQHAQIFDLSQKYGKQMVWILGAVLIAFLILIIDPHFYTSFAYPVYFLLLIANILVVVAGKEIKGSRSWFRWGDIGLQPAEFIKFATGLALAKFLSNQILTESKNATGLFAKFWIQRNTWMAILIFSIPLLLIKVFQNETGLALVLLANVIVLYREGLNVNYIIFIMSVTVLFVRSEEHTSELQSH